MMNEPHLSDTEIVRVLAERGMRWKYDGYGHLWIVSDDKGPFVREIKCWNPLTDLNAVREIEERLSAKQRFIYVRNVAELVNSEWPDDIAYGLTHLWDLRHADARTCCLALVEVLWEG